MAEGNGVETHEGADTLEQLGGCLDDLHAATGTPVTARRPWLRVWQLAFTESEPWAIAVRDHATGRLEAAAVLCRSVHRGVTEVATMGHGRNDRSRLPALTGAAAGRLADAVVDQLHLLPTPWTLRMEQLPADDPVAAAILERLPYAHCVPAAPVPKVEFGSAPGIIDAYLGKGMRKQLRRCRDRVAREGLAIDIAFDHDAGRIAELLVEVERAHRDRDHQVGRRSDLDSEPGLRFWRNVVADHASRGDVEIATLRLAGELAAYVISFLDGDSYRVLDGRFAPPWSRFSPGRLVETATLQRALEDPRYSHLDWMNSVASEKLVAANAFECTAHLVACSPELVEADSEHWSAALPGEIEGRPTANAALVALSGIDTLGRH